MSHAPGPLGRHGEAGQQRVAERQEVDEVDAGSRVVGGEAGGGGEGEPPPRGAELPARLDPRVLWRRQRPALGPQAGGLEVHPALVGDPLIALPVCVVGAAAQRRARRKKRQGQDRGSEHSVAPPRRPGHEQARHQEGSGEEAAGHEVAAGANDICEVEQDSGG